MSRAPLAAILGAAGIMLAASIVARAQVGQGQQAGPAAQPPQADDKVLAQQEEELARTGEDLVNKLCDTSCHNLDKLDEVRRTPREWNDVLVTMATKGATGTNAQFETIRKYLARYYGVAPVNTASAEDLSAVLGLSPKDAAAVVAYREAHGKFPDLDALLQVPGIAKAKLEEGADALRFR